MSNVSFFDNEVNDIQLALMKHALGWDLKGPKHKILESYRNRYITKLFNEAYNNWMDLVLKGYAISEILDNKFNTLFKVTSKGVKLLQSKFRVHINQDKEDIINV